MTELWTYDDGGRAAAGFRGETGDCATRAITIAAGEDYRVVYEELNYLAKQMGINASSARTGVDVRVFRRWMTGNGWRWTPTMFIGSGCRVHLRGDELPGGVLIARCSRHWAAVIDGVVHDTHDSTRDGIRCVYGYWSAP
jgi:hypothetical protein